MFIKGLFKKRISIKKGEKLLSEYCVINGFDDVTIQWKRPKHHTNWILAYHRNKSRVVSNNWVSFHPTRGEYKYSVWIDLITEDISEILRYPLLADC